MNKPGFFFVCACRSNCTREKKKKGFCWLVPYRFSSYLEGLPWWIFDIAWKPEIGFRNNLVVFCCSLWAAELNGQFHWSLYLPPPVFSYYDCLSFEYLMHSLILHCIHPHVRRIRSQWPLLALPYWTTIAEVESGIEAPVQRTQVGCSWNHWEARTRQKLLWFFCNLKITYNHCLDGWWCLVNFWN